MMHKKISYWIVLSVLLGLNIVVGYKTIGSSHIISQLAERVNKQRFIIEEKDAIEAMEFINIDTKVCVDSILNRCGFYDKPLLVFKFSTNTCSSCVDSVLSLINLRKEINSENILIISNDRHKRILLAKLQLAGMHNNKCMVLEDEIFPIDKKNIPYLYIIDKNKQVRMFFIPDGNNKVRTNNYLNYVVGKYLNT